MTDRLFLDELACEPADPWGKVKADGLVDVARGQLGASGITVDDFATPLLTLDASAVAHNARSLQEWCNERGFQTAPHGKTTMAPQIWSRQIEAGAWGITVATAAQLDIALRAGIPRVQLANNLLNSTVIESLRDRMLRSLQGDVLVWVDSVAAVSALRSETGPAISVLLDVGWPGGRTGVRDFAEAAAVIEAACSTPGVVLAGTAGYEGAIGAGEADGSAPIAEYLRMLLDVHRSLVRPVSTRSVYLSVGGSDQLDQVAAGLSDLTPADGIVLVRSGMSIVHDHGLYAHIQELSPAEAPRFIPALAVVSTVLSLHDDGRVILDMGRRDAGYDHGLPLALELWREGVVIARTATPVPVTALNDQHAFLGPGVFIDPVRVGDKIVFGVSHSCTTLDRWRDIVELPGCISPQAPVIGLIRTLF